MLLVGTCYGIEQGDEHRHIAHSREADDEVSSHRAGRAWGLLEGLSLEHGIELRVVVHLHLLVDLHILTTRSNIFK